MNEATAKQYLKETHEFLFEMVKSPIGTIKKRHELTWIQILIYFSLTSVVLGMIGIIGSGFLFGLLFLPIQMTITAIVYNAVIFWITTAIFQAQNIQIDKSELAQVWLKGLIWGTTFGALFNFIRLPIIGLVGFVAALFPAVCIGYAIHIYYGQKPETEIQSKKGAWIAGGLLAILPVLTIAGLNYSLYNFLG